jgi:hypothetical protein
MNVLFCTQSESLQLFDALGTAMKSRLPIERIGFVVADSMAYGRWLATRPDFEVEGHEILKEWEVTARPLGTPDLTRLARFEDMIGGEAGLFGAIVADRRMFMGPDCVFTQDYRRRYSDDELLFILQRGIERVEDLFDRLKPDLVVSFICVTMLDYLAYLVAKARGIRFLNLRPTRIGDRVSFSCSLNDPSPEFVQSYCNVIANGSPCLDEARHYIRRVREHHGRYEGVVRPSAKPALKINSLRLSIWKAAWRVAKNYWSYFFSIARTDNHVPDPLRALLFATVVNPFRARRAAVLLRDRYITREQLNNARYAFYPLHTEPEVSLLVYGRPFINQIEIIRQLAISLPADMILVVKEHPWMVGKRSQASYSNLINIPRVHLARPDMEARELIGGARLVAVITGSVALEAAMLGKPVVTFGDCPYNLLPSSMVRRCDDTRRLQLIIREVLLRHVTNDAALEAYVAAVYEISASVNLYSVLLGKKNVHVERAGAAYAEEVAKLADYLKDCFHGAPSVAHAEAAAW